MPKTKSSPRRFVYVTYIAATPEKLWAALTDAAMIRQYWFGRQNHSSWRTGAKLESRSPEGELEWSGKVIESKKPRRLVYSFDVAGTKEPPSRVTFEIEKLREVPGPQGDALRLTVTHDQFPRRSKVFKGIEKGWVGILSMLKTLLETGSTPNLTWKHE